MVKRLRIIAGPNGSGKSTLIHRLSNKVKLGTYINADVIALQLSQQGFIHLESYGIVAMEVELSTILRDSSSISSILSPHDKALLRIENNILVARDVISISTVAAFIAEWLRVMLLERGISFTFETVMSHPSKIALLQLAREKGYRVYFYFVGTHDPGVNQARVISRVEKGGHPVPEERITQRYYRSMELLKNAIKESNRAFVFDNSGVDLNLVLEVTEGKAIEVVSENVPAWVNKYLLQS